MIDMGCGSGILSIASLLLGAKEAVAVDIDPIAEKIAYENAAMNGTSFSHTTAMDLMPPMITTAVIMPNTMPTARRGNVNGRLFSMTSAIALICVPQPMQVLRGAGVALAARAMWERGECVPPAALLPDYHRLSQAERERAEREKTEGKQNEV